jgi:hypothetical protein
VDPTATHGAIGPAQAPQHCVEHGQKHLACMVGVFDFYISVGRRENKRKEVSKLKCKKYIIKYK